MLELKKRRRINRLIYSKGAIIGLLILVGILARGSYEVYKKKNQSEMDISHVTLELMEARAKEAALRKSIDELETARGKEAEIRDRFNVTLPGERVVVVIEGEEDNSANTSPKKGVWGSVKSFLKGIFE